MKERFQEQITSELRQAGRSETATVVVTIVITFILMGLAMGFASNTVDTRYNVSSTTYHLSVYSVIITFVSLIAVIIVNFFSVRAILSNKKRVGKLNDSLMKMYREEGMGEYLDEPLFRSAETRYNNFAIIMTTIAALSVVLPLVIFINQMTKL